MLIFRIVFHCSLQVPFEEDKQGGEAVSLDACCPTIHSSGPEQGNLPEADSLTQGHKYNAVVGTTDNLDSSRGHNEHFHPNITFLETIFVWLALKITCLYLANVISWEKNDRLQLTDQHFEKARITAVEKFDSTDCFEMNIESNVCHHLARKILKDFSFIKTLLSIPCKLTPSLHPSHGLRWNLDKIFL